MSATDEGQQIIAAAQEVIEREAQAVLGTRDFIDGTFVAAARLLSSCRGKVFVAGAGTSGAVARRMAHLLSVCGTPSVFLPPADALHGTMGAVTSDDILIAISRGGKSAEINDVVKRIKDRGAHVIGLTVDKTSELGQISDLVVELPAAAEADPGNAIAMGSTLVSAVWGDALAVVLMRVKGYTWAEFLHTHPSGAVGQLQELPEELSPLQLPGQTATLAVEVQ